MNKKYTIADLKRVIKNEKVPPPCDETVQVKVITAKNGIASGNWDIDGQFLNGNGVVMGGFVVAAVDIIMAYAMASKLKNEESFTSIDLDTTFHRPAFEGKAEITARIERLGRTIAYVTAEVKQNEKVVASSVSSMMIATL